jgi:hypothetical protein
MSPLILMIAISIISSSQRKHKARLAAEAARAHERRVRWDAATESERQDIVLASNEKQNKMIRSKTAALVAKKQNRAEWLSNAKWVVCIAAALGVSAVIITFLDMWRAVLLSLSIGGLLLLLHSIVSSAVAEGVRKGRQ